MANYLGKEPLHRFTLCSLNKQLQKRWKIDNILGDMWDESATTDIAQ